MVKSIVLCATVLVFALPVLADVPTGANTATKSSVPKVSTHKVGRSKNTEIHAYSFPVKAPLDSSTGRISGKRKHNSALVTPPK